jgi:Family of unknown function (DUF6152)
MIMSRFNRCLLAAVAASIALASPWAVAHHSFAAEFDVKRPVEFSGKVVKVELINPHSWIHVQVTDSNGATEVWMVEGGSPNALFRRGITKKSIPIGSEVVVVGYQARDGAKRAVGRTIKFANGDSLFFDTTPIPGVPDSGAESE